MSLQIELCGVKILSVCDVAEIVTFNKVQARRYIFKYLSTTADGEEKSSSKKAGTGWMAIEIGLRIHWKFYSMVHHYCIFEFFHVVFILAKGREIRKHFQTIIIFKVCSFHRGQDRWCVRLIFEGRVVEKSACEEELIVEPSEIVLNIVFSSYGQPSLLAIFRVSNWVSFHVRARQDQIN